MEPYSWKLRFGGNARKNGQSERKSAHERPAEAPVDSKPAAASKELVDQTTAVGRWSSQVFTRLYFFQVQDLGKTQYVLRCRILWKHSNYVLHHVFPQLQAGAAWAASGKGWISPAFGLRLRSYRGGVCSLEAALFWNVYYLRLPLQAGFAGIPKGTP